MRGTVIRRFLTLIPIALLLVLAVVACGAGDDESAQEPGRLVAQSTAAMVDAAPEPAPTAVTATAAVAEAAPESAPTVAIASAAGAVAASESAPTAATATAAVAPAAPALEAEAEEAEEEAFEAAEEEPSEEAAMAQTAAGSADAAPAALQVSERRVITSGYMELEVEDVPAAAARVRQAAEALGGFVENSNVSGAGEEASAHVTVRVPQEVFADALDRIRRIGDVHREELSAQDVTEQFIDLDARLRSAERTEGSLLALLDRAEYVQDVIAIEWELSRVRTEIERFQGQLNFLERRVAMATLSVSLFTPYAVRTEPPAASFGLEVGDVDAGAAAIEAIAAAAEGLVDAAEITGAADSARAYVLIRVPRDAFAGAVRAVEAVGDVRDKTIRTGEGADDPDAAYGDEPDALIEVRLFTAPTIYTEPPSATFALDSDDVERDIAAVESIAAAAEGLVDVAEITGAADGASAYMLIRVPRGAFAGAVRAVEAVGDVRGKTIRTGEGADNAGAADGAAPDALIEVRLFTPQAVRTEPPSAAVGLDARDIEDAIATVESIAATVGGLIDVAEITVVADEGSTGFVLIRVPRDDFERTVRSIEALGDVRDKTIRTGAGADDPAAAYGPEPDAPIEVRLYEASGGAAAGLIAAIAVAAGLGGLLLVGLLVYGVRWRCGRA